MILVVLGWEILQMYLCLVKVRPEQTDEFVRQIKNWPENPVTGVQLGYTGNTFGDWDTCIWFAAETHDNAINFVQNKIRHLPGVYETYTLPTTTIKEYPMR